MSLSVVIGARDLATVLTLKPGPTEALDTYVIENDADTAQTTGTAMSTRNTALNRRFSLVKFSELTQIPSSAEVLSVILSVWTASTAGAAHTLTAARILAADSGWVEAATWNYADGAGAAVRWAGDAASNGGTDAGCSVSGTDFSATALGTFTVPNGTVAGVRCDCTLSLAEFALMYAANHGLRLATATDGILSFVTSDDSTLPSQWPQLTIRYQ